MKIIISFYFQFLEKDFLENYLGRWEQQVSETPELTKEEKSRLLLSKQIILGWKMTGNIHFSDILQATDKNHLKRQKLTFWIYPKFFGCL